MKNPNDFHPTLSINLKMQQESQESMDYNLGNKPLLRNTRKL